MPDLSFQIEKAEAQRFAAAPTLLFKLRITNATPRMKPFTLSRCAARFSSKSRGGNTAPRTKNGCAIFSASPNAGARP